MTAHPVHPAHLVPVRPVSNLRSPGAQAPEPIGIAAKGPSRNKVPRSALRRPRGKARLRLHSPPMVRSRNAATRDGSAARWVHYFVTGPKWGRVSVASPCAIRPIEPFTSNAGRRSSHTGRRAQEPSARSASGIAACGRAPSALQPSPAVAAEAAAPDSRDWDVPWDG